ncbi:hypothetical protein JCM8547_006017 [Rhodosporidiobolus lusitaniae]
MPERVEPCARTHSLVLDLPALDPAFQLPLFAHLSLLAPDGAALLHIGGQPLPFAFARDASVAMPRPNGPPAATSLSKSNSASLALSARLAKRYSRQLFLTLDLSSLGDGAAGSADRAMQPMEKALIVELDKLLERKKPVSRA